MKNIEIEISKFEEKVKRVESGVWPQDEYMDLNKKLSDIHLKMASEGSKVHPYEGREWFLNQSQRLTDCLFIERFKTSGGLLVADIVRSKNGYRLWERQRSDLGKGNKHSIKGEYKELSQAKAEAKGIVEKYEQEGGKKSHRAIDI